MTRVEAVEALEAEIAALQKKMRDEAVRMLEQESATIRAATIEECVAVCLKIGDDATLEESRIVYDCVVDMRSLKEVK